MAAAAAEPVPMPIDEDVEDMMGDVVPPEASGNANVSGQPDEDMCFFCQAHPVVKNQCYGACCQSDFRALRKDAGTNPAAKKAFALMLKKKVRTFEQHCWSTKRSVHR